MPIYARVSIRDIARRLGICHTTVSLALKSSSRVSKARRDEIVELARKMGYRPDPILASLVSYREARRSPRIRSAIAWMNHWDNPQGWKAAKEYGAYWIGASQAAERYGYRLDEFVWNPDFTGQRVETILQTRGVRGVLIPPHLSQPNWGDFGWDNFSVVRFGLSVRSPDSHVVTSDHLCSVVLALEKIHAKGYKRIGFVIPRKFDVRIGGGYTGGFMAAQALFKMKALLPPLITASDMSGDAFEKDFGRWLRKCKPDALLIADKRVVKALGKLGFRVPEDIGVAAISIQDIPVDAGINQNSEEIGRVAIETLVALINVNEKGRPAVPRRILIQGSWVDGKSMPEG